MVMISELNKNKRFRKQYQLRNAEITDGIMFDNQNQESFDIEQVEHILQELKDQGYSEEVEIYLLAKSNSIKEISKKTNTNVKTISKICNFVETKARELWQY